MLTGLTWEWANMPPRGMGFIVLITEKASAGVGPHGRYLHYA